LCSQAKACQHDLATLGLYEKKEERMEVNRIYDLIKVLNKDLSKIQEKNKDFLGYGVFIRDAYDEVYPTITSFNRDSLVYPNISPYSDVEDIKGQIYELSFEEVDAIINALEMYIKLHKK
jgi:predicted nuclease with TOPRIM domain